MPRPKKTLDPAEVEKHAAAGLAEYAIAARLGVSQDTLTARKRDTPAVAAALEAGRRAARAAIEDTAHQCALQAKEDPRYQTTLIFYLKARCGWKETQILETRDADPPVDREDIARRIAGFAAARGAEAGARPADG